MRKTASILLTISFVALSSSGMLMIVLNSLEFQLQMHGVHKVFGVIMSIAGLVHIFYNIKPLVNYLKDNMLAIFAAILVILLSFLYYTGLNKDFDHNLLQQIERLMGTLN